MKITNQYSAVERFVSSNSGKKHPLFEATPPLTVQEMYNRVAKGIPLSVPIPENQRIPINDKFFVDSFDVLDTAIRNNIRLSDEERIKHIEANEKLQKERKEFEQWKLEQQKQHVQETSV